MDAKRMFDSLEVAIVGSDADMNVIYANDKSRRMGSLVGKNLSAFHKPETMKTIEDLFTSFRKREKTMDYYRTDTPNGKITVVQFPFYENDEFAGVVEFIAESGLE